DWMRILIHEGAALSDGKIPWVGALIKNEEDLREVKSRF
ncbi:MAG TPA: MoxR family ATPase, partial [Leptospiraceae bacterium]|nr:MoxR family ATPase [Leptospiraceae bacterium]